MRRFFIFPAHFDTVFNVVLVEPEIPANTGNIARTCLATGARLHLVKPLGFSTDDRSLRRAGLDYWKEVDVTLWDSLSDFFIAHPPRDRTFLLTTKASRPYYDARFEPNDFLIFGRETKGLPQSLLDQHPDALFTIPMTNKTRSLNLATSVGIVLFEALRQHRSR